MGLSELIDKYVLNPVGPRFVSYVDATLLTYRLTAIAFVAALLVAIVVTVMRVCPIKPLRFVGDLYVQIFRNIPGVSLLFMLFYAMPYLMSGASSSAVTIPGHICVLIATILLASAFGSENFMTGINAIGVGQIEAARSIGLTFTQTMSKIVIPQALRTAILPMTNLLIATMLTTAIGALVSMRVGKTIMYELTGIVSYINTYDTGGITPFVVSALIYALTSVVIGFAGNLLDKKVRIKR